MHGLRQLGEALRDDAYTDEAAVVSAVAVEVDQRPRCLADLRAEWDEPFLSLTFVHADGSVLDVCDGDGYTTIVGGDVNFHGYLRAPELIAVIRAGLTGELTNIRQRRLGFKTADFFEIGGADVRRVGDGWQGIAGIPGAALGAAPLLRDSVRRTRVRFDRAPAFSTAPS
jgi:hypothetical protein